MSTPIPAPRNLNNSAGKRPVPAPRQLIPIRPARKHDNLNDPEISNNSPQGETAGESPDATKAEVNSEPVKSDVNSNTFTRRVRTLSNASKQIAEDIGGKVHEGSKAVFESTRSSVRKITKRFHSVTNDQTEEQTNKENEITSDVPADIFSSISFNSPINIDSDNIYINVKHDLNVVEDDYNTPPPPYPPPPLREESLYDEPQSIASGSTNSSGSGNAVVRNPYDYESVFPSYPYNSDSESCVDMTSGTVDRSVRLNRSESWKFYDQVPKVEQIYNNVDNTPSLSPSLADNISVGLCCSDSIDGSSIIRQNSLYENCDVETRAKENKEIHKKPTESLIMQFDPLIQYENQEIKANTSNVQKDNISMHNQVNNNSPASFSELMQLEQLLEGDLYSNITQLSTADNWSVSNESDTDEYVNPPAPPARFDSLPEDPPSPLPSPLPSSESRESRTNWYTNSNNNNSNIVNTNSTSAKPSTSGAKGLNIFRQVNEVFKKAPQFVRSNRNKEIFLQRPALMSNGINQHKGMLYKVTNGPVEDLFGEFNARWCILEGQSFLCHLDNTCNTIKENFPLDSILSIQVLQDPKYKYRYENDDIHCFELNTSGKSRGGHVYGSRSMSERRVWMQKLAEGLTYRFGPKVTSDYSRMGWAYVREGVSGQWFGAWLILTHRSLIYAVDNNPVKTMDLRKARCLSLQPLIDNDNSPKTTDKGPNLLVDCPNGALYMRMWTGRETKVWCHIIKLAAHNNGANLDQQQLTKNDVPVIVERCINFIYVYGSMSEGIYRRAGSSLNIAEILAQFRQDAWSAQLTMDKYTEHDVATALKRFFRDLPEPLMTNNKRQYFYQVSLVKNRDEKVRMYKAAIEQFPKIVYNTIRKLIGHLHFVKSQSPKNLMTIDNLASVWGPTLMHHENRADPQQDSFVVADLIHLYNYIFPENQREIDQERVMLQVLEKYSNLPHGQLNSVKASGDFRVWVYLNSKQGETHNIAIGPQKTAYEVCAELSTKMKLPVHKLQLEELVLNNGLARPIHHTEKVLDVVLKWGYWDEADRKDNCLVLSPIAKYSMYVLEKTMPVSGELRYADSKTRNFRSFMFEFSQAKLNYYKDRACMQKLGSWKIEDLIWYLGNEPRRNAPSRHTITFITKEEKPNRTKSNPWFGNVLAWNDEAFKITWIGAMWRAAYPQNLTPPPQHVNVLNA